MWVLFSSAISAIYLKTCMSQITTCFMLFIKGFLIGEEGCLPVSQGMREWSCHIIFSHLTACHITLTHTESFTGGQQGCMSKLRGISSCSRFMPRRSTPCIGPLCDEFQTIVDWSKFLKNILLHTFSRSLWYWSQCMSRLGGRHTINGDCCPLGGIYCIYLMASLNAYNIFLLHWQSLACSKLLWGNTWLCAAWKHFPVYTSCNEQIALWQYSRYHPNIYSESGHHSL